MKATWKFLARELKLSVKYHSRKSMSSTNSSASFKVFAYHISGFLTKEVYGRIKPTNYLLLFLIALGGRNSKLYTPIVMTIQKLFSNNFINADE